MILAFVIWLCCRLVDKGHFLNLVENYFYNIPIDIIGSMAGTFVILWLSKKVILIPKIGEYLTWIGRYSLVVLCSHLIELNIIPWAGIFHHLGIVHLFVPIICCKILWITGSVLLVCHVTILREVFGMSIIRG